MQMTSRSLDFRQFKRPNRLQAGYRTSWIVVIICFIVVIGSASMVADGQSTTTSTSKATTVSEADLERLSDQELESICTTRGFELVREEENGQPFEYTHDDYVEAARRCLEVEREMNDILQQHPELAVELDAEIKRMEKEQQAIKLEKARLEDQLAGDSDRESVANETSNSKPTPSFGLGGPKIEVNNTRNDTNDDEGEINLDSTDGDSIKEKSGKEEVTAPSTTNETSSNQTLEADLVNQTVSEPKSVAQTQTDTAIPMTLNEVLRESFSELIQKVEEDVKRVIALMVPVMRTVAAASNTALKYLRLLLNYAQTAISEAQKKRSESAGEPANKSDSEQQPATANPEQQPATATANE